MTAAVLARFPLAFAAGGTVTAGNSCFDADGAAAVVITSTAATSAMSRVAAGAVTEAWVGTDSERDSDMARSFHETVRGGAGPRGAGGSLCSDQPVSCATRVRAGSNSPVRKWSQSHPRADSPHRRQVPGPVRERV